MNNTIPVNLKTDIKDLKGEVKYLRTMLERVIVMLENNTKLKDDVSDEELMVSASKVFNVTGKKTKDDANIADPKNIKPVDFSSNV